MRDYPGGCDSDYRVELLRRFGTEPGNDILTEDQVNTLVPVRDEVRIEKINLKASRNERARGEIPH